MSHDATPSNALTLRDELARLLAIEPALAQKVCLAVAQVVAAGHGRVEITVKHHQVHMLYTTISEEIR
jgi:hypothetical protein